MFLQGKYSRDSVLRTGFVLLLLDNNVEVPKKQNKTLQSGVGLQSETKVFGQNVARSNPQQTVSPLPRH